MFQKIRRFFGATCPSNPPKGWHRWLNVDNDGSVMCAHCLSRGCTVDGGY